MARESQIDNIKVTFRMSDMEGTVWFTDIMLQDGGRSLYSVATEELSREILRPSYYYNCLLKGSVNTMIFFPHGAVPTPVDLEFKAQSNISGGGVRIGMGEPKKLIDRTTIAQEMVIDTAMIPGETLTVNSSTQEMRRNDIPVTKRGAWIYHMPRDSKIPVLMNRPDSSTAPPGAVVIGRYEEGNVYKNGTP